MRNKKLSGIQTYTGLVAGTLLILFGIQYALNLRERPSKESISEPFRDISLGMFFMSFHSDPPPPIFDRGGKIIPPDSQNNGYMPIFLEEKQATAIGKSIVSCLREEGMTMVPEMNAIQTTPGIVDCQVNRPCSSPSVRSGLSAGVAGEEWFRSVLGAKSTANSYLDITVSNRVIGDKAEAQIKIALVREMLVSRDDRVGCPQNVYESDDRFVFPKDVAEDAVRSRILRRLRLIARSCRKGAYDPNYGPDTGPFQGFGSGVIVRGKKYS